NGGEPSAPGAGEGRRLVQAEQSSAAQGAAPGTESEADRALRVLRDHGQRQRGGRVLQPGDGVVAAVAVASLAGGAAIVGWLQAAAGASGAPRAVGRPLGSLDVAKRGSEEPYALVGQVRICGRRSPRGLRRPGLFFPIRI